MKPRAYRRGAHAHELGCLSDRDDSVVMPVGDTRGRAEVRQQVRLRTGISRGLTPCGDRILCCQDLAGIEEIGRAELADGSEVAGLDP